MTDENTAPRLLSRQKAAAYLGLGTSTFSAWVSAGLLPKPVFQSKRWDREALDAAIDRESGIVRHQPKEEPEGPLQKWLREAAKDPAPSSPIMRLNQRQEIALRALGRRHPEPQPTDAIDGVGERTMEELIERGAVRCDGRDKVGRFIFKLSKEGKAEYDRYVANDEWERKRRSR